MWQYGRTPKITTAKLLPEDLLHIHLFNVYDYYGQLVLYTLYDVSVRILFRKPRQSAENGVIAI
jgi:hypothetical protein